MYKPLHLRNPFANDSNSLDRGFYNELLHIMGLGEVKEGGKKTIRRKEAGKREMGSLLENAITQLDRLDKLSRLPNPQQYGITTEERLFSVAMELIITWINQILFLKLLEAQLIGYHKGDKRFAILTPELIHDYDDLNNLFFGVLAKRPEERRDDVKHLFAHVPYLNSSLFEPTEMEHNTLFISNLTELQIPVQPATVLKDANGHRIGGQMETLAYLFAFLDAYDFTSEGAGEVQEENKTLINASVLGLIFEKINGYKDGSFFTPGFITMYMARETLRRAVVQKFNEAKGWNCTEFDQLYDQITDKQEANTIINSLKICDPAVGSGHFLVSCLNEMIAIKSDLRVLQDRNGKRLKEYQLEVVNDELIVTDEDGDLFAYNPTNKETQRVQETLFHEKQTLIENCLFGVDINPNSVKICRLRLWIELLKNAYYKEGTTDRQLETLPNIDINIKCGNSLVSRYGLDADLKSLLRRSKFTVESYRLAVSSYRNAGSKAEKAEMNNLIVKIKQEFTSEIRANDPLKKRLDKLANELYNRFTGNFLFEPEAPYGEKNREMEKRRKKEQAKLEKEVNELEAKMKELRDNQRFVQSMEWRIEFPEVLDVEGRFTGFDVVIGNPPYIRQEELTDQKEIFRQEYATWSGTADLYVYFVERAMQLLRPGGHFAYIMPNKWMRATYGRPLREFLLQQEIEQMVDFGDLPVFDEATTYPCLLFLRKGTPKKEFSATTIETLDFPAGLKAAVEERRFRVSIENLQPDGWTLTNSTVASLLAKIRSKGKPLGEVIQGRIFYGIKTGLNEAFVIDTNTRDRLVAEDPRSAEVLKPFLAGRDIRRYRQPESDKWLILFRSGDTSSWFGKMSEAEAWKQLSQRYPAVGRWLEPFADKAKARYDKGEYWWELRACDYYDEFEKPKIMLPDIAQQSQATFDESGLYCINTAYILPEAEKWLLAILNSDLIQFYYSSISPSIRGGYFRYIRQYLEAIPVVVPNRVQQQRLEKLVSQLLQFNTDSNDFDAIEQTINQEVCRLYGIGTDDFLAAQRKK
ncbi:MAG: TaqI-like C-terminal specificity domain-containing protein [Bacteroidales bacterium]|nr:TaqI-like C-terminal specificity domain-containing protein [Bacteroidales bacterium]